MKKNKPKLLIRTNRSFSEEFKKSKVKELIEKQVTVTKLSRLYGVTRTAGLRVNIVIERLSVANQKLLCAKWFRHLD